MKISKTKRVVVFWEEETELGREGGREGEKRIKGKGGRGKRKRGMCVGRKPEMIS